jgi:hypothetical protein
MASWGWYPNAKPQRVTDDDDDDEAESTKPAANGSSAAGPVSSGAPLNHDEDGAPEPSERRNMMVWQTTRRRTGSGR